MASKDDIPEEPDTPEPKPKKRGRAAAKKAVKRSRSSSSLKKTSEPTEIAALISESPENVNPEIEDEAFSLGSFVPVEGAAPAQDGDGTPSTAVPVGTRINNNYEILELVSAGGMGEVYRGVNYHTGDQVAIKIVLPSLAHDEKIIQLFRREARILGKLYDEAIVRYLNFVKDEELGRFCLIMEFVEGVALSDMMDKSGALPLDKVKLLIRRLANGLDRAHALEITHRDVSPDNIIVPDGNISQAKLIDFGIAKSTAITEGTLHGQFAGKFNFVSPEQLGHFDGNVDARSDVYALGLLAAGAARGEPLPMGASIVDAVQSRSGIPDLSDVYLELRPLLSYMLEPDPVMRPNSMAEVAHMLDTPSAVPTQYQLPEPKELSQNGETDSSLTVVRPMISAPPVGGISVPPSNGQSYSADSTGVAVTGALSLPPQVGRQGFGDAQKSESPFGSPSTETVPRQEPDPEPKKSRVGKTIGFLLLLAMSAGFGGAAYLGVGPFALPEETVTEPIEEQIAIAPEPEPEPIVQEPAVVPEPEPEQGLAPEEPTPLADVSAQLAWLDEYETGRCVYQAARGADGDVAQIEGFATSAAPFETLLSDFENAFGFEPNIGVRLIRDSQCEVIEFVKELGRTDASVPVLELNSDVLKSGDTLQGRLTGVKGRPVYLFLVSGKGGAFNLTNLLTPQPDGSQSFRFGMNKTEDAPSVPQMIVAVTTRTRLVTANAARDGADVQALMPIIATEIETSGTEAAASLQYFRLEE